MLDFRMETFLAVCQCMNFTRASEKLNITQPAVSQHIRFLEKHYRTELFRHEGKKLKLTRAGEILRKTSLKMMNEEMMMFSAMQSSEEPEEIRFGVTETAGDALMGAVLEQYLQKYPEANIRMVTENTQELRRQLDEGRIDFALVEGFLKMSGYDFQKYSEEEFVAVCSPDYSFRKGTQRVVDLLEERVILSEEGSDVREALERYLHSQDMDISAFRKRVESGSMNTLKELAKSGRGITFLYESAARNELEKGELVRIPLEDFHVTREFVFIWRRGSIYADKYREILRQFCA